MSVQVGRLQQMKRAARGLGRLLSGTVLGVVSEIQWWLQRSQWVWMLLLAAGPQQCSSQGH